MTVLTNVNGTSNNLSEPEPSTSLRFPGSCYTCVIADFTFSYVTLPISTQRTKREIKFVPLHLLESNSVKEINVVTFTIPCQCWVHREANSLLYDCTEWHHTFTDLIWAQFLTRGIILAELNQSTQSIPTENVKHHLFQNAVVLGLRSLGCAHPSQRTGIGLVKWLKYEVLFLKPDCSS